MKLIEFPEQNLIIAKDQPEYIPLPAYRDEEGQVITCWQLTWKERFKILFTGKMWLSILTFKMRLQPQLLSVDSPFIKREEK